MNDYIGYIDIDSKNNNIYGYFYKENISGSLKAILKIDENEYIVRCDIYNDYLQQKINSGNHAYKFSIPKQFMDGKEHCVKLIHKSSGKVYYEINVKFGNINYCIKSNNYNPEEEICKTKTDDDKKSRQLKYMHEAELHIKNKQYKKALKIYKLLKFTSKSDVYDLYISLCENEINKNNESNKCNTEHKNISSPKISVIIAAYNCEEFIERCIESLILQTFDDFEIICVDDGSTDGTYDILKGYEKYYHNIHIYSQKNQYAGIARNNGMSHANGEYLLFLDSDDFFNENMLEIIYKQAKKVDAEIVVFKGPPGPVSSATQGLWAL